MKTFHALSLVLSFFSAACAAASIGFRGAIGAALESSSSSSSSFEESTRRHDETSTVDCVQVSNVDGMNGPWMRGEGLHNGYPYYYNGEAKLYLHMTRPMADRPVQQYYAVNDSLDSTSVLQGYCSESSLDIMDCNGRWRANMRFNTNARFEACGTRNE